MGHTFKTKLSWTPRGYNRTLTTDLSLSVGGLPTEIRVTKLPNKMDYKAGETFDPTGIIVHAYYEDGSDYGTVLNSELSFDPMNVSAATSNLYTDGDGVNCLKVHLVYNFVQPYYGGQKDIAAIGPKLGTNGDETTTIGAFRMMNVGDNPPQLGEVASVLLGTRYQDNNPSWNNYWKVIQGNSINDAWMAYKGTYDLYFLRVGWSPHLNSNEFKTFGYEFTELPISTKNPNEAGDLQPAAPEITVIWHRPADGATLTCPLTLNVEPGPSPDPPGPVVPEKVVGGDDVAIPAQAHSGDNTITGATYPNATSVGDDAFNGCTNLQTTNIPNAGVIGLRAFADCEKLTNITDGSLSATT